MQITINENEIVQAIIAYVGSQINIAPGQSIAVDLKAGRGDNGFTATLDIVTAAASSTAPAYVPFVGATPVEAVATPAAVAPTPKPAGLKPFSKLAATPRLVTPAPVVEAEPEAVAEPEAPVEAEVEASVPVDDEQVEQPVDEIEAPAAPVAGRSIFSKKNAG